MLKTTASYMPKKYLSFSPYLSGLSNVMMCYEFAFSLAYLTKRTIILPPDAFVLFVSDYNLGTSDFVDIWQLFDKDIAKQEFDVIEHKDVPEFQGKFKEISTQRSYTENIKNNVADVFQYNTGPKALVTDNQQVFVNDLSKYESSPDFYNFVSGREIVDLNVSEQFIHFENNPFGHFWYHVYPGDAIQRNHLKDKINRTFRYKQKFFDYAQQVKNKIGPFNALHVRRNDFFDQRAANLITVDTPTKLLNEIERVKNFNNLPLYISTDEPNKEFFNELKKKYNIYFYRDFDFNLTSLEEMIVEQTICSEAEFFLGTYLSTYTKRINLIRGIQGKQADDYMGINSIIDKPYECNYPLPWTIRENKHWYWNDSCHPQWMPG